MRAHELESQQVTEKWSKKYKRSIDCSHPKGFSQKAHCAGRKKHNESSVHEDRMDQIVEGLLTNLQSQGLDEIQALEHISNNLDESLHDWFKEKWVRFGPDGKIRGACARGSSKEGKPKCLPQSKAHSLGKKARATAARRKRREDPNPNRKGKAHNVKTKESTEQLAEKCWTGYHKEGNKKMFGKTYPNCVKNEDIQAQRCPQCGGHMLEYSQLDEKKDACYYKVKSRYKVWPSAYASGALVKCRKAGAGNWGNKSKK